MADTDDISEINITNLDDDGGGGRDSVLYSGKPATNFGGGLEMLMNEKRLSTKDNDLGNIDALEHELDELGAEDGIDDEPMHILSQPFVKVGAQPDGSAAAVSPDSELGKRTAEFSATAKTWDEYENLGVAGGAFDPDTTSYANEKPPMTKDELLREKFTYLRKLEELEKKGVQLTKSYNMESSLSEMQGEYETIIAEKERSNSVKFQAKILMACITGVEFLNNKFDPFDIKLDGWSEQINENVSDYDEVFSELHEKYRGKGKMAPELKLMFQVAGSAMMIHMTNTMFKSAVPGMDDIMRQNPELMQQFTRAAASSMSDSRPGMSDFMNMSMDMGGASAPPRSSPAPSRPSMRGPDTSDMGDILSNMKAKVSSDVHEVIFQNRERDAHVESLDATDKSSNISIHDLKELAGQRMPRRGRRSGGSKKDAVTVSVDI